MESGLASRWKLLLIERSQRKSGGVSGSQAQSTASPLNLQDVAAVLELLLAGSIMALVALLAELGYYRLTYKRAVTRPIDHWAQI